eukprot:scaffold681_cov173-Ochromonas_danica.AAC.25
MVELMEENKMLLFNLQTEINARQKLESRNGELTEKLTDAKKGLQETRNALIKVQQTTEHLVRRRDEREEQLAKVMAISRTYERRIEELEVLATKSEEVPKLQTQLNSTKMSLIEKEELISDLQRQQQRLQQDLQNNKKQNDILLTEKLEKERNLQSANDKIRDLERDLKLEQQRVQLLQEHEERSKRLLSLSAHGSDSTRNGSPTKQHSSEIHSPHTVDRSSSLPIRVVDWETVSNEDNQVQTKPPSQNRNHNQTSSMSNPKLANVTYGINNTINSLNSMVDGALNSVRGSYQGSDSQAYSSPMSSSGGGGYKAKPARNRDSTLRQSYNKSSNYNNNTSPRINSASSNNSFANGDSDGFAENMSVAHGRNSPLPADSSLMTSSAKRPRSLSPLRQSIIGEEEMNQMIEVRLAQFATEKSDLEERLAKMEKLVSSATSATLPAMSPSALPPSTEANKANVSYPNAASVSSPIASMAPNSLTSVAGSPNSRFFPSTSTISTAPNTLLSSTISNVPTTATAYPVMNNSSHATMQLPPLLTNPQPTVSTPYFFPQSPSAVPTVKLDDSIMDQLKQFIVTQMASNSSVNQPVKQTVLSTADATPIPLIDETTYVESKVAVPVFSPIAVTTAASAPPAPVPVPAPAVASAPTPAPASATMHSIVTNSGESTTSSPSALIPAPIVIPNRTPSKMSNDGNAASIKPISNTYSEIPPPPKDSPPPLANDSSPSVVASPTSILRKSIHRSTSSTNSGGGTPNGARVSFSLDRNVVQYIPANEKRKEHRSSRRSRKRSGSNDSVDSSTSSDSTTSEQSDNSDKASVSSSPTAASQSPKQDNKNGRRGSTEKEKSNAVESSDKNKPSGRKKSFNENITDEDVEKAVSFAVKVFGSPSNSTPSSAKNPTFEKKTEKEEETKKEDEKEEDEDNLDWVAPPGSTPYHARKHFSRSNSLDNKPKGANERSGSKSGLVPAASYILGSYSPSDQEKESTGNVENGSGQVRRKSLKAVADTVDIVNSAAKLSKEGSASVEDANEQKQELLRNEISTSNKTRSTSSSSSSQSPRKGISASTEDSQKVSSRKSLSRGEVATKEQEKEAKPSTTSLRDEKKKGERSSPDRTKSSRRSSSPRSGEDQREQSSTRVSSSSPDKMKSVDQSRNDDRKAAEETRQPKRTSSSQHMESSSRPKDAAIVAEEAASALEKLYKSRSQSGPSIDGENSAPVVAMNKEKSEQTEVKKDQTQEDKEEEKTGKKSDEKPSTVSVDAEKVDSPTRHRSQIHHSRSRSQAEREEKEGDEGNEESPDRSSRHRHHSRHHRRRSQNRASSSEPSANDVQESSSKPAPSLVDPSKTIADNDAEGEEKPTMTEKSSLKMRRSVSKSGSEQEKDDEENAAIAGQIHALKEEINGMVTTYRQYKLQVKTFNEDFETQYGRLPDKHDRRQHGKEIFKRYNKYLRELKGKMKDLEKLQASYSGVGSARHPINFSLSGSASSGTFLVPGGGEDGEEEDE